MAFEPGVVILTATLASQLPMLGESLRAVRADAGDSLRLYAGGSAIREAPDVAQEWGADGVVEGLRHALETLESPD